MSQYLFVFLIIFVPSWGRIEEVADYALRNCVTDSCFHQSVDECPGPDSPCRCHKLTHCRRAAICCNVDEFQLKEGLGCANIGTNGEVEALHIRNATIDILNVTLPAWRRLRYMTVTDGQINSVIGEFGKHTLVSCLNLSSNGISRFEDRSLVNLFNLSYLDLSNNNLSDVPRFKKEGNVTIDISDNKKVLCISLSETIKRNDTHFHNDNKTFCSTSNSFNWFNSSAVMPLSQVIRIHKLRSKCCNNCSCVPRRLDIVPGKPPTYVLEVNCFGQELMSLPSPLPPNTIALNISNNNITSLEILSSDPSYQDLRELYADNNQIKSILPLEGSKFMTNFAVLSLRNNKLTSLPTYILSNIFDRNYESRMMYLGLNKLECDCNTAKVLKGWLMSKHVHDYNEIDCENMNLKVVDLNPSKLCQSHQDWTDYIYYVITIEVLLLVGLIAKVSYDYWVFKTAGYLPWPASKMPRLPCDWLCE